MKKKTKTKQVNKSSVSKSILIVLPILGLVFIVALTLMAILSTFLGKRIFEKSQESSKRNEMLSSELPHDFPKEFEFYPESSIVSSFFSKKDNEDVYTINFVSEEKESHSAEKLINFFADEFSKNGWTILEQSSYNTSYIEAQKENIKVTISAKSSGVSTVNYSIILVRLNK